MQLFCSVLDVLHFKKFELYWGAVFFKEICSQTCYHDICGKIEVMILVTPKQEVEQKDSGFAA